MRIKILHLNNVHRILTKANYTLQTDVLKSIMPRYNLTKYKEKIVYASEADMLNLIIFGCTAKDWEQMNPELAKKGYNLRDTATINQLVVLSNIEARNSELLKQHGSKQKERMRVLHADSKRSSWLFSTQIMLNKSLENYWAMSLNSWSKLNHSNFSLFSNNLVVCNRLLEGSMEMKKVNIINDADKKISSLKKELKRTDDP